MTRDHNLREQAKKLLSKKGKSFKKIPPQRKQAADALRESEARYRGLFEGSPISLWEEDFSSVKQHIDKLRASGVSDFRAYFEEHPEEVVRCVSATKIIAVNQTTLKLFKADSKERLLEGLNIIFSKESFDIFKEELITFAGGETQFQSEAVLKNLVDDKLYTVVRLSIAPGYEDTWGKVLVSVGDITERKRAENSLIKEKEFTEIALDSQLDTFFVFELTTGRAIRWNKTFGDVSGYTDEEIASLPAPNSYYSSEDLEKAVSFIESIKRDRKGRIELSLICKDGHKILTEYETSFIYGQHGEPEYLIAVGRDITKRKRAEENVLRLNRLYSVLSKVNEAIVRIRDPEQLYERVCRIAVEDGQFKMAWIGLTDPKSLSVRPVASYGDTGDYLKDIMIYAADVPEGRGPTGKAVFEGIYSICSDIEHDPRMLPWREKALRHGFRSSAAFPLHTASEVMGAFTIYSSKPQFFTDEEIGLLSSLAEDISFAISSLANEKKKLAAEEALRRERDRAQGYLDTVETIIVVLNPEGRITTINRKGCQLFGYKEDELIGQLWFTTCLPQPDGMENVYPVFLKLVAGEIETTEYFENPIVTRSGELRQIAWHNALLSDEQGRIIGTLSSGEDITERKKAEAEIKNRVKELEEFYDMAVGRELRMIELKEKIEELTEELEKYKKL